MIGKLDDVAAAALRLVVRPEALQAFDGQGDGRLPSSSPFFGLSSRFRLGKPLIFRLCLFETVIAKDSEPLDLDLASDLAFASDAFLELQQDFGFEWQSGDVPAQFEAGPESDCRPTAKGSRNTK